MNRAEWALYEQTPPMTPIISGDDFDAPEEGMRLLCKGYMLNGGPNMRVWLRFDGQIGVQYDDREIEFRDEWDTDSLYPSKRAYREDTDLHFAMLMRQRHEYPLSFTTWRTA